MSLLSLFLVAAQALQFEVATLKQAPPRDRGAPFFVSAVICHGIDNHEKMPDMPAGVPGLGRCMVTNGSLRQVIAAAYPPLGQSIPLRQRVIGGPDWIDNEPFNMEGKAENTSTVTEAELKSMLQHLLTERFKLEVHKDTREVQGFALVATKDGPKLKPGTGQLSSGFLFSGGTMSATNATMETLAYSLSTRVGGLVINETGLDGGYAITVPGNIGNDPNGSSASTALQELGLRLESRKVKIDVIVIDRVERPVI